MRHTKNHISIVFSLVFFLFFCALWVGFAWWQTQMFLWILPPTYQVLYSPVHTSWTYTTAPVFVSITGNGIKPNETGIRENGTYTIQFYRWTWPFTTWAWYSSDNTRSLLSTTQTIDWIDNISPVFSWAEEWTIYTNALTLYFSDNLPGVTATLNGNPFVSGTPLSTNGVYQLIVTDAAGNRTWVTFTLSISSWWWGGWGSTVSTPDTCTIPSALACANTQGIDYSDSRYDATCCAPIGDWPAIGVRLLTEDMCKQRNCYSSYYESLCGSCSPDTGSLPPLYGPPYHYNTPDHPSILWSSYPSEWNHAYQRAYTLGITNANTIQDADMEWLLYRKIAAKMSSEFAIKVLGLVPDTSRACIFPDIKNEAQELQYYIKLSCQLGVMGLNYYGEPDVAFNPNYFVTRDQLVTILSRLIFRNSYNLRPEEYVFYDKLRNFAVHTLQNISDALHLPIRIYTPLDWYTKHLEAIKKLWIIIEYDLTIKELRWYFILIMYRLDQIGIEWIDALIEK